MTAKGQPGIERRIAKVSLVTGLSTMMAIGLQLVSVPVCLRYWGNDTYGTWLAIFAAFTLMRTVDGGYIGYVGNKLNMLYHRDEPGLRKTLASAVWGVAILGGLQLIILALLYATHGIGLIMDFHQNQSAASEALLALLVLCVSWIFTGSYLGIVHRFLIPAGLMYQSAWWAMGFQVAQFSALIAAASLELTILEAAVLFALVQAVVYVASAIYIKWKLPRYYPWWLGPSRAIGLGDLLRSVPFTFAGVVQQGGTSGLVMLVSAFLGAAAVPAFVTVRTLTNLWTTLINILTAPLLPEVVRFHSKGEGRKLVAVHQAHWLLLSSAVNLSILAAYPFLETIYGTWTNHHLLLDKPLLSLLLAAVSLAGMSALMNTVLSGVNHFAYVLTCAALRGGLVLLLSWLLLPKYGTTGLGVAVLSAEALVLAVTLLWFFRRELVKVSGESVPSLLGWSWLSSMCVVAYLFTEGVGLEVPHGAWLALAAVVLGSALAWHELDTDIKLRMRSMLHSANET